MLNLRIEPRSLFFERSQIARGDGTRRKELIRDLAMDRLKLPD